MKRPRFIPRYWRANRSHCFYTNNYHFHAWRKQPFSKGTQTGVTLKHRTKSGIWRHWTLKFMTYSSNEKHMKGRIRHFEFGWHDAGNARGDRVKGSKRYLRFKVCL